MLQILGTPESNVIFTSYDDRDIGQNSNPRPGQKEPGDWAASFSRMTSTGPRGEPTTNRRGFLNYVGQADLRYGGGNVTVDAVQQMVDPIRMVNARPTILYNTISFSADAALSANPNSFLETNFHALDALDVDYQLESFTPDYEHIRPELRGDRLVDNSINGIFVRISTPAGNRLQRMTVSGRWDDTDLVHVVAENLLIEGQPGRPRLSVESGLLEARPDAGLKIEPGIVVKLDGAAHRGDGRGPVAG